jgi:ParB-like chromosome segregation protein Spo0J
VIPQSAIDKVAASIQAYGFVQPIVVEESGVIVIGHVRRLASIKLGLKTVPVHVARGLSPEKIRGLRIMENRSHSEAEFDVGLLAGEMADLSEIGFDLSLTGFDPEELGEMIAGAAGGPAAGPGHASRNADRDKMLHVVVYMQSLAAFEEAIRLAGQSTRAAAVMEICQAYIRAKNAEVGGISLQ